MCGSGAWTIYLNPLQWWCFPGKLSSNPCSPSASTSEIPPLTYSHSCYRLFPGSTVCPSHPQKSEMCFDHLFKYWSEAQGLVCTRRVSVLPQNFTPSLLHPMVRDRPSQDACQMQWPPCMASLSPPGKRSRQLWQPRPTNLMSSKIGFQP